VNVHHLELFFYVAKHGGISSAVRHMPYGIQQPAVSGQILQLEEYLGQKLFHRRPFSLTPAGERLFRFIQPFFENLELVSGELRGHQNKELRLAASSALLREYGPRLLDRVKQHVPELRLILREADQSMAEDYLLAQEVHLAVTELYTKPASGIQTEVLSQLPLVLLVAADSKLKKAKEILAQRPLPLISVSATSALYRTFQDGLRQSGPPWEIKIELSTLEMVQTYAGAGYGVGLSVRAPGLEFGPDLRAIDLDDFPRLKIAAFWQEPLANLPNLFLEEIRKESRSQASLLQKSKASRGAAA
jgi:DNA-binding transcriptional LysR family regulator